MYMLQQWTPPAALSAICGRLETRLEKIVSKYSVVLESTKFYNMRLQLKLNSLRKIIIQ